MSLLRMQSLRNLFAKLRHGRADGRGLLKRRVKSAARAGAVALGLLLAGGAIEAQTTAGYTSLSDGGLIAAPDVGSYGQVNQFAPVGSRGGYLWVEGVFGERPGSDDNYVNIGSFLPGPQIRGGLTFADVQIFGDENSLIGIDANFGWRKLITDETMVGFYGFYTHDHSRNEFAYDQGGFGVQVARSHVQVDGNAYLPFGDQQNNVGLRIPTANIDVQGRTVGFIDQQIVEQNMRGVDANVTAWVPGYEFLYGGAGVYHFNSEDGENSTGYRIRAGLDFDHVQINANMTNDGLFGTAADISVAWLMGREGIGGCFSDCERAVERRLYDRVVKQRRIATTTFSTDVFTAAPDGRGGTLDIAWVDNTNAGAGDGSLVNPFNRLDRANGEDVDIVAVFRGNTNAVTKLQAGEGLFMTPYQRLVGEGLEHFINIPGRGTFLVPGLDTTGTNPYVTANIGASIVNIASNTEVNGFNLMPPTNGFAIRGNNFQNFQIQNINQDVVLPMSTGPGAGILLRNVTGTGLVNNVAFNISDPFAYGGIRVENTNMSPLDLTISNSPYLDGGQVAVGLTANNSEINAIVDNVDSIGSGVGLRLETNGTGELNVAVADSFFMDTTTGPGVAIVSDGGLANVVLINTDASFAATNGLGVAFINDGLLNLAVVDSDFSGAGVDGIRMSADDSDIRATFLRTPADDAGRDGINLFANNTASIEVEVTDGSFTGAGRDAEHYEALNLSTITAIIDPTPSTGAGRHGIWFNAQGDSTLNVLQQDSHLSIFADPTGSDAIFGMIGGGSLVNLTLDNSGIAGAGGDAMRVMASGGSEFNGTFLDSVASGAAGDAFDINLDDSIAFLTVSGAGATAAGGNGLIVNAINGSGFVGNFVDSSLTGAGVDGVNLTFDNSDGLLTLTRTPVINAGDNAFDLSFTNGSILDVNVIDSPATGAGNNAVVFNGDVNSDLDLLLLNSDLSTAANPAGGGIVGLLNNGSTANLTVDNSDVMNVAGDGLSVGADNGSTFVGTITDSSFDNAGDDAFAVMLDNGSNGGLTLDNAPGNGAGGNGLNLTANNASVLTANLSNGTTFNNVGDMAIRGRANSGSTLNITGDGVSGMNAAEDAIELRTTGGTINFNLTNAGNFSGAGDDAIDVSANAGTLNIDISGGPGLFEMATFEGFLADLDNGSTGTFNLTNVSFDGAGFDGVDLRATDSAYTANFVNSSFNNVGADAFDFFLNNSTGTVIIDGSNGMNASDNGLEVMAMNGSTLGIQFLNGVSLAGAGNDAINVTAVGSTVMIDANGLVSGANAGGDAIQFSGSAGATVQIDANGNFDNAGGDGVVGTLTGGSTGIVNLTDASFRNVGGDTFSITATDSTFAGNVLRTDLRDANGNAVNLVFDNSTGGLLLTQTLMDNAGADSLHVEASNASMLDIDIINGSVMNAGDDAYDITFLGGSVVDLFVDPTDSTGAASNGLEFLGDTGSTLMATFIDSNLSTAANPTGGTGVQGDLDNGSTAILTLTNSDVASTGGNGIDVISQAGSVFNATVTDSSLANEGGTAIILDLDASSSTLNLTNVDAANAASSGIDVFGINGSNLVANLSNVDLSGAGIDAILVSLAQSTGQLTLTDVNASNATGNGLIVNAVNGTNITGSLTNVNLDDAGVNALTLGAVLNSSIVLTGDNVSGANAGIDGIQLSAAQSSDVSLTLTNAGSFASAGGTGLNINSADAGSSAVAVLSGTPGTPLNFNGSGRGIDVSATNGGFAAALLTDVTATGVTTDALRINATNATANVAITNGDLSMAGDNGVELSYTNSMGIVNLTDTAVDNATVDAFNISTTAGSDLDMKLTTVSAAGAGDDTFDLTGTTLGTLMLDIDPNDLTGAGDNTFEFNFDTGAGLTVIVADSPMSTAAAAVGNNVILGTLASGATADFTVTNSEMSNAGNDAVNVLATGVGTAFTGSFTDAAMNNAGGNIYQLDARGGATIGVTADNASGMMAGADAILLNANDGTIGLSIANSNFNNAGGDALGVTAIGGSTVGVTFNDSTSLDNAAGRGIGVSATDSTVMVVGEGVSAASAGGGAIQLIGDTSTIGLVLTNAGSFEDAGGNGLEFRMLDGTINIDIDGASFDNAMGGSAITGFVENSTSVFNLNNFSADGSAGIGLELTAESDGTIVSSITNGSFDMNAQHGIKLMTNPNASLNDNAFIDIAFNTVTADANMWDGFNAMAFNGNDTFGMPQTTGIMVDFRNGSIQFNGNGIVPDGLGNGVDAMASGDGSGPQNTRITFNFVDTDIANNEEDQLNRTTSGGGAVDFSFTGGMIGGQAGLALCADGPLDVFNFSLNGTTIAGNPMGPGLLVKATNDGIVNAEISNVDFSGNGEEGVRFYANTGGNIGLTLRNVDVMNNGTTGSFDGIFGTIGVLAQAESLLTAGKFSEVEVNLIDVNAAGNPESGFDLDVATGGQYLLGSMVVDGSFTGNSTGGVFDEIEFSVTDAGSSLSQTFDGTAVDGAVNDAFNFSATNKGNLAIGLNNVTATNAGDDALSFVIDNAKLATSITGFDGSDAGGRGASFDLTTGANVRVNNFNNVMLQNAGGDALDVTAVGSSVNVFNSNTIVVSGSGNTGLDINVDAGIGIFDFDGVQADNNNIHGLFALYNNGSTGSLTVNDVWAQGNTNGAPFVADVLNGSSVDIGVTNGAFTGSSVFVNNVQVRADNSSTANASFDNVVADGAMLNGFFFDYQNGSNGSLSLTNATAINADGDGVHTNVFSGSDVTATFDNVNVNASDMTGMATFVVDSTADITATNIMADSAGMNGVTLGVDNSTVDASFTNVSAVNAGLNGFTVSAVNGSNLETVLDTITADGAGMNGISLMGMDSDVTAALSTLSANNAGTNGFVLDADNSAFDAALDGLNANMAGANGVLISYTNGSNGSIDQFDNVSATGSGLTGMNVDVVDSQLTTFNGSNIDVSGSGTTALSSGLGVTVTGAGALADLDLTALTSDGNSFRGVSLVAEDTSALNVFVDSFSADNNGRDGLFFSSGFTTGGAMINATFANGSTSNNGLTGPSDGVVGRVLRVGSVANVAFDNVQSISNSDRGFDLAANTQGTLNVSMNNGVSASNNTNEGVFFSARHAGTTGSLSSMSGNNTFSNNGGTGVDVNVNEMAVATDITVRGDASGNGGDGVNVTTDGSGVTINNLSITGTGVMANNNTGTGVVIDLDNVGGMTAIDVSNFTVTGNLGTGNPRGVAGIDVSLANMTLDSVTMDNLDVSGNPGGTGIGLQLDGATTIGDIMLTNFTTNNNGGSGVDVEFVNGSSADTLALSGSANGNMGDGLSVVANDGSAQTVNDLLIMGAGLTLNNNTGTGLIVDLDNVSGLQTLDISGLTVTGNMGVGNTRGIAGVDVSIANMTLDDINMSNMDVSNNSGGTGIGLLISNSTVNNTVSVSNFTANGNGGGGVIVDVRNGSSIDTLAVNGSASNNTGDDGLRIVSNVGAPSTINNFTLSGAALTLNNNNGNGLTVDFNGVLGLTDFALDSLTVNGNTDDQINVALTNMTLDTVTMSNIVATGPGAAVGMGDGIELTLDGTDVMTLMSLSNIQATNNGEDGLQVNYLNGATTPIGSFLDIGQFNSNGLSGIHLILDNSSSANLDITNTEAAMGTLSTAMNNGRDGLEIELTDNAKLTMESVDSQIFNNNGRSGVMISASNSDFLSTSSYTNNSMSNNGSFGFFGRFLTSSFDISIGSRTTAGAGNLIDNNVGAGIAIEMIQDATGRLAVLDNQITNTADDGNPMTIYQGDGVVISQTGTSSPTQANNTLNDPFGGPGLLIQGNSIGIDITGAAMANAGHGVTFQLEEQSTIDGLVISQNMIANNGIDGVNLVRFDEVSILGLDINQNVFMNNTDDAIHISGENDSSSSLVMDVTIQDNDILTSGNNGIELHVNADAGINANILRNNIIGNGNDGLNLTETVLTGTDLRVVSGIWDDNIIANNTNRGIFSATTLNTVSASNNTIGAVLDAFGQVMIDGNGSTGVLIFSTGASTTSWTNNTVIRNGRLQTGNRLVGQGFHFEGGPQTIALDSNLIQGNFQDGVEILNNNIQNPAGGMFGYTVSMTNNRVQGNQGRGLDILNRGSGDTLVSITNGNVFNANIEEGIYAVNTSSTNQNQTNFASAALLSDGATTRTAQLALIIDDATVSNNGDAALVGAGLLSSTGLVVRSGTTAAPRIDTGANGVNPSNTSQHFATNGSGGPSFTSNNRYGGDGHGGVFVSLTNSTFGGNFGDDTFFHGFVSTAAPQAVGGTWNDMVFTPGNRNNGDPLARLDLVLGVLANGDGNVFDSVNFINSGRLGTPGGQAGAFYQSADATFKSRDNMQTPGGPFPVGSTGRRRNAQRTPVRTFADGSFLNPDPATNPDGGQFQFPGMGDSTFRVRATSGNVVDLLDLNNNGTRDAFEGFQGFGIFDDDALLGGDFGRIESNGEQNGVGFTGGINGELPFGWGTF